MNAVVHELDSPPPAVAPSRALSPFAGSTAAYELALRQANALSAASLVPDSYKGAKGLPNILIAMELANRIGASPLMVMQSLYIVQGKPSWSSSFLIATVNACGRFEPIRFEIKGGDDPSHQDYMVRAFAKEKASGEVCYGTWITWKMVKAEAWDSKSGSKWKTMPGQMFMYRAAGFWTRVYAPEISLGIHTTEEVVDVWGAPDREPHQPTTGGLKALAAELALEGSVVSSVPPDEGAPPETGSKDGAEFTFEGVKSRLEQARNVDELNDAADLIGEIAEADQRAQLTAFYNERLGQV